LSRERVEGYPGWPEQEAKEAVPCEGQNELHGGNGDVADPRVEDESEEEHERVAKHPGEVKQA